ncbi:DUF4860 domain-containing protein [Lachnospiraceae bacterium 29-84]
MKVRMQHRHVIDFTFPIAVFFVFAASSLVVLMLAANIYSTQTADANNNYMARTSLSYVNEKIRQNDTDGGISIQTLEGQECLALELSLDSASYTTYIYPYHGNLKELFIREGVEARLQDGRDIMEIQDFSIEEIQEGLFRLTSVDIDGKKASLIAAERSTP